jgi:hypothetical protein
LFAEVVLTIGIGATTAILTRRQLSAAGRREMDQAVANRAMSRTGGPAPRQRSIEEIRGRVIQLRGNIELFGPGAKQPGRALNLTNDNAFVLSKDWDDVFFVAAHATENSMSFYADISGTVSIGARALAVQMFKAGYRGGDVVLLACEAGLNRGLVRGVHKELSALGLSRPVGAIHAPRRAIIGAETVRPHPELGWAAWESYSFN